MARTLILIASFVLSSVTYAATLDAFQKVTPLTIPPLKVPTLVTVPFSFGFGTDLSAVLRKVGDTGDTYVPFLYNTRLVDGPIYQATIGQGYTPEIIDGQIETYTDLPFESGGNSITMELKTQNGKVVTASGIQFMYAQFSSRPIEAEVQVIHKGNTKTLRARSGDVTDILNFPEESGDTWSVTLWYDQPVRIAEVLLVPIQGGIQTYGITFLAEPNVRYELFSSPDRHVPIYTTEAPDLSGEAKITGSAGVTTSNPMYIEADTDSDGIVDTRDNCPGVSNAQQEDVDGNSVGDACDDFDRDGYVSAQDNCPLITNSDQRDTDGDKKGDVCDGEESRPTEQYPWLPWVGIGFVALLLIGMTTLMMRQSAPPTV